MTLLASVSSTTSLHFPLLIVAHHILQHNCERSKKYFNIILLSLTHTAFFSQISEVWFTTQTHELLCCHKREGIVLAAEGQEWERTH